ncbi:KdpD-like non-kinase potassium sensor [Priestia megaterium]|uniref:KdpD-like non-kinase potassium sensor n=1 Tax=Priestia megaterium TaxID=1404 RepID=UPI000BF8554E|nr:KdpD-like non-kinase potassium sensor [Priestia megaterium]MCM3154314.1 KdpD-like non-kinase potassium sensor [Priestia megaterium]MDC7769458.1 KdpD-like non-kinase potassium sensor [Priestia megaterium]PEU73685.1 histidine kinase [Priestia megaterium]PFE00140.1 histidine kinase [Priestia megaterium]PFW47835.1 histidine kinase [Priestia megaterium]
MKEKEAHPYFRRKTPEELLRELHDQKRGKLKLYIGAAPGVGKTYKMLQDAHDLVKEGIDVVVGYIEAHGRHETKEMIRNLEVIERETVFYKGKELKELDLLAIVRRRPKVVIIDELAHTNVPTSRHKKRFEDVSYLLNQGISVMSAMNIQHMESVHDLVYAITQVKVRETVPDLFIQQADEIQLVDVTPEQLQKRLREGKIYEVHKIEQSLQSFFKLANLHALRELTLREVADEVDGKLIHAHEIGVTGIRERILVCIQYSGTAEKLIRRGWRMANRLKADLLLLHVFTGEQTERQKAQIKEWREFADRFHASLIVEEAKNQKPAAVIVNVAKQYRVTQILLGQSARTRWEEIRKGSIVNTIMRQTYNIDIHIVSDSAKQ